MVRPFLNGKERLAGGAIEEIEISLLGCLCDRIDTAAIVSYREQRRGRRKVAIPDVMMHPLKVPKALAGLCIEREQGVCEEVVSHSIRSVEIEDRGAGGNVDDAALFVERHPGPVVGRAGGLPGVRRPCTVTEFIGMGDGVKAPAKLASTHIEGANVAWRRWVGFRIAAANDDQILVNHAGAGEVDGLRKVISA